MNNDDKKLIGNRCLFSIGSINQFGNIEIVDHDGIRLLIRGDNGVLYERWKDEVLLL